MAEDNAVNVPQARDAERSVLGSMLRDNSMIDEIVLILTKKEVFYLDAHQKIFEAIVSLRNSGRPADLVTLADLLKERKKIEDIGGYSYIAELWDAAPTAANAAHYARIVLDKAVKRGAIYIADELKRDANEAKPAPEVLRNAERGIVELAQQVTAGQVKPLSEGLRLACDEIDQWHGAGQAGVTGLATGFADLDELTCGLRKSELIILAARPSIGKTALALNIARHIALEQELPLFLVSLAIRKGARPSAPVLSRPCRRSPRPSGMSEPRRAGQTGTGRGSLEPCEDLHRRSALPEHAPHLCQCEIAQSPTPNRSDVS
jgi:replicative DNA helicase